jgi:AcrR family transcriptional regulator
VSLRSLYHHFADLDELLAEAASRVFATIEGLRVEPDTDRPLAERITDFVDVRARTLEAMGNFWRAALIAATTSEAMRANMVRGRKWLRRQIRDQFAPELALLPDEAAALRLDALQVTTSAAAWDLLRTELGLSVDRARRVMDLNVRAALGPGADGQGPR